MRDFSSDIAELLVRVESAKAYLGFEGLMKERDDLEKEISDPELWGNPDRAKAVNKRFTQVSDDLGIVLKVQSELDNIQAGVELAQEEESEELEEEIEGWIKRLGSDLSALETRSLLYGEFDEGDAISCSLVIAWARSSIRNFVAQNLFIADTSPSRSQSSTYSPTQYSSTSE